MWQRFAVHKNERSLEPELRKLLFPFGTVSERREKKGYLLPLRNFLSTFLLLVTDKGNDFNTSEKCLIISSCEIWVLVNESLRGTWLSIVMVNVQPHIRLRAATKGQCWLETAEHLPSLGVLQPVFFLKSQENVIIKSTALCQIESNFSLTSL